MLFIFLGIFLLIAGLFITINTQWFKDKLVDYATEFISDELNYPTSIESAEISYFNSIQLNQVKLKDVFDNDMILIESANVKFDLWTILNEEIIIENVFLQSPKVHLIKNKQDGLLNLNEFIKAIQKKLKKEGGKPPKVRFKISSIQINDGLMSYDDRRKDSIQNVFDYYHFNLENIHISANNFNFENNITSFSAKNVSLIEPSYSKNVANLNSEVSIGLDFIELDKLTANIGESSINNYLKFEFENYKAFDDFNNLVTISTTLDNAKITSKDIGMFSTTVRNNLDEIWTVSGDYKGKITSFKSNNFKIKFGTNSTAQGKLNLDGLPDFYNTFMEIDLKNSHVKANDLAQYFPSQTARKNLPKFGHIEANGSFIGFPLDFVAFGNFNTLLGSVKSDINLKITEGKEKAYYKGNISTDDFKLGRLTKQRNIVKKISIDGNIEGTGLTLESANFKLDADIHKLELLNYTYQNIKTDAEFSQKTFDGNLSVDDENIEFIAEGLIDFNRKKPVIKVKSNLNKADLKALNFTDVECKVKTNFDVNVTGIDIDEIVGAAKFDSLEINYDSNYLNLSSITLFSALQEDKRSLTAVSPYFYYKMNGAYKFTQLRKDLLTLKDEIILGLKNDKTEIDKYYAEKSTQNSKYKFDIYTKLLDPNPLFKLYNIPLEISEETEIFGSYKQGKNSVLSLNTEINHLKYDDVELNDLTIDLNSSKYFNKSDILAMALIESKEQKFQNYDFENLHIEGVWANNHLELESFVKQKNESNQASLISVIDFYEEQTNIKLKELELSVLDQNWSMVDSNSIIIKNNEFEFNNLTFGHDDQSISLKGIVSKNANKTAQLSINNFNLDILNPLSPQPLSGETQFNLHLQDLLGKQKVFGNYTIDSLNIANNDLGTLKGMLQWDKQKEDSYINFNLIRDLKTVLNVNGLIYPFRDKNNFDLKATLNSQKIDIVEPYFKAYASKFDGNFNGKIDITGDFNYPILKGSVQLENVSVNYDYLNVTYLTNSTINLSKDKITFNKFSIKDKFGSNGEINGYISHKGFKEYNNDIDIKFENLFTLNTTFENNELYFGKVFSTGNAQITGPTNDITLKASAKTNKNTDIFIPLNGYEGVEDKDFIKFVSFKDRKIEVKDTSSVDLSGINMDFNFEITPDAYMEIIFDPKAGDIIKGNGSGDLNLVIDTRGEFNVYGDYRINKGTYNFTLLDVVNKEFEVTPGSTVNWNGDPYKGNLNIEAKYQQRATLSPIVLDTNIWVQNPSLKFRKYPTDVLLYLKGELLQPEINLDIDIEDENLGILQTSVSSFENEIKNNEQELNRQVFSLIILKQFAQINSQNNLSIGASAGRSMSELVSNQLSYWMSQVDDNLEIDLDLGSLSAADNSSYQLRLSYSFLDGRLRLSNQTDYDKSSDLSTLTGEWTLEYMITKDGKLRLKMYNRTSQNNYSNDIDNSTQTTAGTSILYTRSFSSLKELFQKKDKKEKE